MPRRPSLARHGPGSGRVSPAASRTRSTLRTTCSRAGTAAVRGPASGTARTVSSSVKSSSTYGASAGEGRLHPPVRLVGAVAEPDDPLGRVVDVVAHLLDALAPRRRRGRGRPHRRRSSADGWRRTTAAGPSRRRSRRVGCSTSWTLRKSRSSRQIASRPRRGRCRRARRPGGRARGPGRAGRGRCWPAPCPPRAAGRWSATPPGAARRPWRRRRAQEVGRRRGVDDLRRPRWAVVARRGHRYSTSSGTS